MIIDFHVHTFPGKIAPNAIASLQETAKIPAYTNGTLGDTVSKIKEWGIDRFAMLNIATSPRQQDSILRSCLQAREKYGDVVIPFPSIHPDAPNALEMLDVIAAEGFSGIKIHPDYQNFFIDDEKMYPIYYKCASLGFTIIFHAGVDPVSPDIIHATPQRISTMLDRLESDGIDLNKDLHFVAAHMGGIMLYEDVIRFLVGRNIYFDTSFSSGILPEHAAKEIIKGHGADKVIFASDCPWKSSADERDYILRLGLSSDELEMIFHLNAEKLILPFSL